MSNVGIDKPAKLPVPGGAGPSIDTWVDIFGGDSLQGEPDRNVVHLQLTFVHPDSPDARGTWYEIQTVRHEPGGVLNPTALLTAEFPTERDGKRKKRVGILYTVEMDIDDNTPLTFQFQHNGTAPGTFTKRIGKMTRIVTDVVGK